MRASLKADFTTALAFGRHHRQQYQREHQTLDQLIDDFRSWQDLSTGALDLIYNYYRYYFFYQRSLKKFSDKKISPPLLEDLWGLAFSSILTRSKTPTPILGSVVVDLSGQKFKKHTKAVTNAFVNFVSRNKTQLLNELQQSPQLLLSPELQQRWQHSPELLSWPRSILQQNPKGIHAVNRLSRYQLYSRQDFLNDSQLCSLNPGSWQLVQWITSFLPKSALQSYTLLDTCAAPGGKSIALATKPSRATFYATDSHPKRLQRLQHNIERMGFADKILTAHKKWGQPQATLPASWPQDFDFILLDLPCSATGTIFTQSDVMSKNIAQSVKQLAPVQQAIIEEVRTRYPQAQIFVSLCSVDPTEIASISQLLKKHTPDFESAYKSEAFTEGLVGWKCP